MPSTRAGLILFPAQFYPLSWELFHFDYLYPDVVIHAADILHSGVGPYAVKKLRGLKLFGEFLKQRAVKPLLGKKPNELNPYRLTIRSFALKRH